MFYDHFYEWDSNTRDAIIALVSSYFFNAFPHITASTLITSVKVQVEGGGESRGAIAENNGGMSTFGKVEVGIFKRRWWVASYK